MTRKTIIYKGLSIRDPAPYGEAGLAWQENFISIADTLDTLQGSLDTALGGLVIGVDIQAYSANLDTWSSIAPSADAQALAAAADYAAMRGLLGVRPGADVQVYSEELGAIAGLTPIDGNVIVGDGSTWVAESGATARASLGLGSMATQAADAVAITGGVVSGIADLAVADGGTGASDAAGARANLGLAIGADVQAHSATLDTWAGVLPSANGQSLVSAVDYAAMRGLLDLEPGTDVQAYSSRLGAIAALTPTDGNLIVGNGTTWVTQSGETARTTLGLGSMATQAAGDVAITGGAITGITDLAVTDGGTGASDAAGARENLGFTAPILDRTTPGDIGATTPGAGTFTTLESGEHSILSDTVGLKLDAAGTTTLYSDGLSLKTNKRIDAPGLELGSTTTSSGGIVFKDGVRFLHDFHHPTGDTVAPIGHNVFLGMLAGNVTMGSTATSSSHSSHNVGVGYMALVDCTTGYANTALGSFSLYTNTTGYHNVAVGWRSLYINNTGNYNSGIGFESLLYNTTGSNNIAVGRTSLVNNRTGSNNIGIGYNAGSNTATGNNTTSENSIYIGVNTKAAANGDVNEIVIGDSAIGKGSDTVQIGNSFVTDTYISGWLNLQSDTQGIKFDAAGSTTLYSDGTHLRANKAFYCTSLTTGNIGTPETTSSTIGVVNIGDLRIHGFRHPTGGTERPDGNNVFIGLSAGNFTMGADATSTTHASKNTGIGYLVLNKLTTGYGNTAIGDRALLGVTEGTQNTAIGQLALMSLTTGTRNVGLGYFAGRYTDGYGDNQTTSNSTYIGASTRASSDGVTNETVIGYNTTGRGSNTVRIGNSVVTDTYISGWLNLLSDTRGIKLDAAGTTTLYSDGSYLVANKGFINPGTMVEVAGKNRSMVYGHDGTYAYLVYQPYVWSGSAWTATRGCGFGMQAIEQNTGTDCAGVGYYALRNNTGHVCAGLGAFALADNTGGSSIGFGYLAGRQNTGLNLVALGCFTGEKNIGIHTSLVGFQAGRQNTGTQVAGLGYVSLSYNTGDNVVALGYRSGLYNTGNYNTFLGFRSANIFDANDSAAKTFDYTAVDPTTDRITIPAHGFGNAGQYKNLKFTQGTSPITGLTSGNIYQAKIIDANTIGLNEPDGPDGRTRTIANITAAGTGTGHTFTPQYEYNNATCVGANSAPSASNQVTLGDTAVTEVKTSGVILPGGYKASDGSAGISKTITITDKSDVTHTLVFKDGLLTSHTTN